MALSWLRLLAVPAAAQALLLALRLSGVIRWPWWAVLAPAWVTVIAAAGFAALVLAALGSGGHH